MLWPCWYTSIAFRTNVRICHTRPPGLYLHSSLMWNPWQRSAVCLLCLALQSFLLFLIFDVSATHSLTAALDQLRVVASSTSNDPGPRSRQHRQIGQCLLPLAAVNFSVDDPAGASMQSAAGGVPVWASIDSCSACEAGVFSGRRQMWPNNEWRLSVSFSHWLLRWIPCHTIWYQGYDAVPACEKTGSCLSNDIIRWVERLTVLSHSLS